MDYMGFQVDSPEELRQKILDFLGVVGGGSITLVAGTHVTIDNTDPAHPIINAKGILPVVTGSVPPELVYLPDGSLVYSEI